MVKIPELYNDGFQKNLDLDRIDDTKYYCPSNCQCIKHKENMRKK